MQRKRQQANYRFERLEPRLLLSADPISSGLALLAPDAPEETGQADIIVPFKDANAVAAANDSQLDLSDVASLFAEAEDDRREVAFINGDVVDYQTLIDGLADNIEVVILDNTSDGIQQINEYLASKQHINAVHIVSHGNDSGFWLGNTFVDQAALQARQSEIASWSDSLNNDADVLIYGCNLAGSEQGQTLLDELGTLTDADIAASDDLTGSHALGGDWELEYSSGTVESAIVFSNTAQTNWFGTLDAITVTTTTDVVDGDADTSSLSALLATPGSDGLISLREAVIAANNGAGADMIFLGAGNYRITEITTDDTGGDFDIRDSLSIVGDSPTTTSIDGNSSYRVFDIHDDVEMSVSIANVKIENGITTLASGYDGAAVWVRGGTSAVDVHLSNVWLFNNNTAGTISDGGGAIYNENTLYVSNSLIEHNTSNDGGGIYNASGAILTVTNTTFSDNSATSGSGGALNNQGTATLTNVTIADNSASSDGGGIHTDGGGFATISNSIVSGNTAGSNGPDVNGTVISGGNNIIGDDTDAAGFGGSDHLNVDPLLGLLMDNGGELKTHAPGGGSVAIDGADPALAPSTDQLGLLRDATPDIGAFEVGATNQPEQGTLWFTTDKAVSGGGQNGLDTWDQADVMTFDDPLLNLGAGTTSGTVGNVMNFDPAVDKISGLHFVSQDVDIAGGAFSLLAGDVLINSESNSAVFTSNNVVPLAPGFSATVNADRRDIVVFRPDTPGDYSVGQFAFLIDDPDGGDLRAFSLVETTTEVGGSTLNAGDFLFVRVGGSEDQDIKWFSPTTIGNGTTTGAMTLLLDGDDANVGIAEQIHGIELIETTVNVGNVTLTSGQILVSVQTDDTVGNNNLDVGQNDIFILDVAQSTAAAGAGNGEASASKFFTGANTGFDTNDERFNSLALKVTDSIPTADASAGAPHTITAGGTAAFDGSNSSDPDGSIATYEWDLNNDGSFEKTGVTTSFDWSELSAAGVNTDGTYDVALRVTDNQGYTASTVFTLTVNNDTPTFTAFAGTIDTTNEETEVEITFAELAAQGDEADFSGSVDAFVVQSVVSGTLKIGADAGSATAFAAGTNDVLGAGLNAYWTPATDQTGTLNAFSVKARDDDGAISSTAVTAQVAVTNINDAPTLSGIMANLATIDEDTTSNGFNVANILSSFTTNDADGDTLGIALTNTTGNGAWQYSADSTDGLDGTWQNIPAVDPDGALLLANTAWIRYVPDSIAGETALMNFRAWDMTSGSASTTGSPSLGDTTPAGGTTAFSTNQGSATVTVTDVNDAPSFSAFGATIDTTNEDTEVEITFSELVAQGNEADVDGMVNAFVVQAVSSGTLRIGADSGTATAFVAGVNDVIGAGLNAYWTPASDQNGTLNAFSVEARDDGGALSGTPVTAQMTVNDVNDAPTFTAFTGAIDTTNEDTEVELTFAELLAQGNEADIDGSVDAFVVQAVSSGTLRIGATSGSATAFVAGVNDVIDGSLNAYWTPAADQNGTLNAFSVEARDDDGTLSGTPVTAHVAASNVNDAPTLSGGPISLGTIDEDNISMGFNVANILSGFTTNDADGDTLGIALTNITGNSTWQYSADSTDGLDGTWQNVPLIDQNSALLLTTTSWIRYAPDTIAGETVNINFRAWDMTSGSASTTGSPSFGDTTPPGGTTAFSVDQGTATVTVTEINDLPTFTAFSSAVDSTNEDTEVEITFAELAAQGDEADIDGTVDAFVVQAVSSGTLTIGADSASATAFVAGVNDVIGAGLNAYWTPASDQNGTLNAFTVEARDDDGALSGTPVTAQITVNDVNDAPTFTTFASTIDTTNEDTEVEITLAELLAQGDEGDIDGTVDAFVVQAVSSGTLTIGADSASATAFIAGVNDVIGTGLNAYWTPASDQNGTLNAFTVEARDDDGALSGTPVTAQMTVNDVNDAPTLTTFASTIDTTNEDTEVEITLAELLAQGNEADVDGTVDAFVVQAVSSGTLKIGADSASATAFAVGVNDVIGAGLNAYWTPASDQNGTLNAFTVEARDDDGALSGTPIQAQVSTNASNDAPVIAATVLSPTATESGSTTGAVALIQGGTASVNDPDAGNFNGGYVTVSLDHYVTGDLLSVSGAPAGIASISGGNGTDLVINLDATANALAVENILESIRFIHNGDDPTVAGTDLSRNFNITLNDGGNAPSGALDSNTLAGTITLVVENDAPTFTSLSATVQTANTNVEEPITFADIHAVSDAADVDGVVNGYVVKNVLSGSLRIGTTAATATAWVAGVNDTIDAANNAYWTSDPAASGTVNAFDIVAKDDGNLESAPSVTAQLTVFLTNQAPTLDQNTLQIDEGGSKTLSTADLSASDVDDPVSAISITASNVQHGQFERLSAPGLAITNFTQSEILAGDIRFVHDGGEAPPTYSITVSDGALNTPVTPATIIFTPVNDAPTITLNQLSIEQDGSVTLSVGENVGASDPDNTNDELSYQVSNLTGGRFELASSPGVAINSFSAADLIAGKIKFIHDGGSAAPSYEITVSDGSANSNPSTATINFTPSSGDELITNERAAAESFASELVNEANKLADASEEESTQESDASDKPASEDVTNAELLAEQALNLRADAPVNDSQQALLAFTLDSNENNDPDRAARDNDIAKAIRTMVTTQLRLAPEIAEPILSNIDASFELVSKVIKSSNFNNSLDLLRDEISNDFDLQQAQIGSSIAVSTGLSIGYVVWLIRGGVLVSSMLSALPAWRFIDPLPILAFGGSEEDEDQESLETLVQSDPATKTATTEQTGDDK